DIITTYRGNIDQLEAGVLPRDVDDYDMTFATSNPNYKIGEIEGDTTLKINKNTLTVTAKNVSITIGDAMPEFTYDIIGYCGEDDDSQVSVMPVINSHASAVGVHDLIPSGGNARNYNFKYVKGYLTINGTDVNGQIEGTSSSFSIKGVFAPNISYLGSTVDVKADEAKNFEKTARDYRMLNFTAKLTHVYKLDIQNGSQISEKVSISIDNVSLNAKNKYFIVVIDHNGVVSKVTKYQFVDGVLTFNSYGVGTVLVFQDNLAMTILFICIGALAVFTIMLYITSKFTYIVRKKGLEEDRKNKKHETKYQW
ncbi:MAG: hypothetical protein J6R35_01625, partial [Clostridia bacterium]|nr:hypothetical protein [Clostridia bacterium]